MNINVIKRNGSKEQFSIDKIHKILTWASEGFDVSISDIEMNAELNLYDGITTEEIHRILIKSANDLISVEHSDYQFVAARLLNYSLRKQVWGESDPPRLYDHLVKKTMEGVYDPSILEKYDQSEILKLGKYIKHKRDDKFTYAGLQQLVDKYLIKNRKTKEIHETPQFAYMLIAMTGFANESKNRIEKVKEFYDYISTFKISLPTPIIAGVRSPIRQYASCALFDCGDSLDSIFSTMMAVGQYSAKRSGIGLNMGRIRPVNSFIRGGEVIHTGVIPYLKVFESIVKSTQQNGIRGSSSTIYAQFWHYEIEDILVLKNNAGTDDNRVRKLDYAIQFSGLFYKRLIADEYITLFSPHECEDLYEAFGTPDFDRLYVEKENDPSINIKKKIKARSLAELFAQERLETGRIYVMNIDHCNQNSPFENKINMSNLCVDSDTVVDVLIDNFPMSITMKELDDIFNDPENNQSVSILSKNLENQTIEYQNVSKVVMTGEDVELIEIIDTNTNKTIQCTPNHKIYTKNRGYVEAQYLTENDELDIIEGQTC